MFTECLLYSSTAAGLHLLSHLIPISPEGGTVVIPCCWCKNRHRVVKWFTQDHTARGWESQFLKPDHLPTIPGAWNRIHSLQVSFAHLNLVVQAPRLREKCRCFLSSQGQMYCSARKQGERQEIETWGPQSSNTTITQELVRNTESRPQPKTSESGSAF